MANGSKKHNSEQMQRMRENLWTLQFHQAVRGLCDLLSGKALQRAINSLKESYRGKIKNGK